MADRSDMSHFCFASNAALACATFSMLTPYSILTTTVNNKSTTRARDVCYVLMTTTHDLSYITDELQHVNDDKGGQLHGVRGAHRYVSLYALVNIYSIDVIARKTTTTKNSHHWTTSSPAVDSVL